MTNKIIKIKESELVQLLVESLGVNIDVDILSKFLIDYLKDKKYDQHIINKNQLLELNKVNINKIIIDYSDKNQVDYFDIKKSRKTNDGEVLYFHFDDLNPNSIYHEINHALQFFIMGKERNKEQLTSIKASRISRIFIDKNNEVIKRFSDLIYKSTEQEINSEVSGLYGELITHLRNKGWKKGQFKNDEHFKLIFEQYVNNSEAYNIALNMINYNIFEEFDIKNLIGIDDYDKRVYFTIMQDVIKSKPFYSGILDLFRLFKELLTYKYNQMFNVNILTEEQVNSLMKKYQLFINKQGEKLKRKLFRLYYLFL